MKVTKGVIWALAGVLTLGAVLGGGPVWTAALAHAGEEPPSSAVPAVPGKGVPEQLALARLGGLGLTEEDAEALWADLGEDRRRELIRSLGAPEWLDYLAFGFSWWDRLDRYEAYHAQHPELTAEEAVVRVNAGLDAPPYGDPEEVEDPDSLTALVNQYHALPADYAPKVVYLTAAYTNQRDRLRPVACRAFMEMADAAAREGLRIYNASAYRSYTTQKWVYQRYVNQEGTQEADTYSARMTRAHNDAFRRAYGQPRLFIRRQCDAFGIRKTFLVFHGQGGVDVFAILLGNAAIFFAAGVRGLQRGRLFRRKRLRQHLRPADITNYFFVKTIHAEPPFQRRQKSHFSPPSVSIHAPSRTSHPKAAVVFPAAPTRAFSRLPPTVISPHSTTGILRVPPASVEYSA